MNFHVAACLFKALAKTSPICSSIGHYGVGWGHPIDRVCRPLLGVCLGRRRGLALTSAVAGSSADSATSAVWTGALSSSYGLKQGSAQFTTG